MSGLSVSFKYNFLIIALAISSAVSSQIVITKPILSFSFLCESQFVNTTHTITFTASPSSNINSNNVFTLEMSNNDFATAPLVVPATVSLVGAQYTMTFSLPTVTFGPNYKLRVRSSSPAALSPNSDAFDAYYIKHNQEILVNSPSGVDNVAFCSGGGSFTLFIYNSGTNSSPLFYPELTYVWKKKQLPTDIVVGTGSSLTVTQPGQYFVETNYGVCTPSFDSRSRIITVSSQASSNLTITSSSGNQICEGSDVTLTGNLIGPEYTYQWYKDNQEIVGATNVSYLTTTSGDYKLITDNGICVAESNVIILSPITFTYSVVPASPISIYQGQTVNIVVTTTAASPVYQWYKDNVLLPETTNTLAVNQIGTYKVIVNQTSGCIVSEEVEIVVQKPEINEVPNLISPNNDGVNDTWVLPNSITSQSGINVKIFNSSGKMLLSTDNYLDNWPTEESDFINSNAVFYYIISKVSSKIKQGTITVIK